MKITSVNNELIKETAKLLNKKYREESRLFLIEGEKAVQEAISSNLDIEKIFVLDGHSKFPNHNVIETTEAVLSKISDAKSAPKIIAVAKQLKQDFSEIINLKKVILLEDIKDAGNLGTIIRTATAFNIDAIVLFGDTIDLYNPKCVRSAVGNLWKTPIFEIKDFSILQKHFESYERIATLPKSDNSVWLNDYIPGNKTLIMFGSEANGLSDKLKNFATKNVTIEMATNVESLNLSISAGLFMYKIR